MVILIIGEIIVISENSSVTMGCVADICKVVVSSVMRYYTANDIFPSPDSTSKRTKFSVHDARKIISYYLNKQEVKGTESKVQCFYNFKGGTGKTSVCFQVSSMLAICGYNVLVVDSDPQGHLSNSLGLDNSKNYFTLYDWIINGVPFNEVKKNIFEGLDCIPANLSLTKIEVALNEMPKREERITMAFSNIAKNYDFVIFDTNPTISLLNRNIVAYSDAINIVCETQSYSLNGLNILMEDLGKFFQHMHQVIPKIRIIPNKYEERSSISAEAISALHTYYPKYIIKDFAIRKSEDINIAAKMRLPLPFFCKKNSIALEDIIDLVHNFLYSKQLCLDEIMEQ
jgi:chromosome partitioning protein